MTTATEIRIGVVGTDNSHTEQILRLLNTEGRLPGVRVTALSSGDADGAARLAGPAGVEAVLTRPDQLPPLVDAAIVTDRDGGLHAAHALPLLRNGLPVLVDKPLATSVADARSMLVAAAESAAPLTSFSALRWLPAVADLADPAAPPVALQVTGPASPASEYGGVFFYGIHAVELACQLTRGRATFLDAQVRDGAAVLWLRIGQTSVTVVLVDPAGGAVPFHASAVWPDRVRATTIQLDADYLLPGLTRFVEMVRSGERPLSDDELLDPISILADLSARWPIPGRRP